MNIYTGYHANIKKYRNFGLLTLSISIGNPKTEQPQGKIIQLCPSFEMVKNGYTEEEYYNTRLKGVNPIELFKPYAKYGNDII